MAESKFEITLKGSNGSEIKIPIVEYIPSAGRGANKPKLIPANLNDWKLQDFVDRFGETLVLKRLVMKSFKPLLAAITEQATTKTSKTPTGEEVTEVETDEQAIQRNYNEMLSTLSIRGETRASLLEREDELLDEINDLIEGVGEDTSVEQIIEMKAKLKELKTELASVKASIESKKREPRAATPVETDEAVAA